MESSVVNSYIKAGDIAKQVSEFMQEFIKKDMLLVDIAEEIENKIRELGADPAFPVNTSIDEVAAHYTPTPSDENIAQGLLKVDVGVCVDGFIADFARSFDLSEDNKYVEMIKLNQKFLSSIKSTLKPDSVASVVGNTISSCLDEFNSKEAEQFSLINNLCGHNLGKDTIHAGLTISNLPNESNVPLSEMAFAVEPFLTTGVGSIYEGEGGGIYAVVKEGQTRDPSARKLLSHILTNYKTRPFCERWLVRDGFDRVKFALSTLVKQGIIHHYPLLIEKSKTPVSQYENSFLIDGDRVICYTQDYD